jgi:crossover junction endodeoxyribonuclease RusA
MARYRRPIHIPTSRLPLRHNGSHRVGPTDKNGRPDVPLHLDREKQRIALTLPVPPSINHQYATVNGRRLLSSTGRSYKEQVGQLVWLTLTAFPHRAALLYHLQSSCLALSIRFYFTTALRRDVDGGLKIAQDALCEGLGLNDNRIIETHLYKHVDRNNPRIEVLLAPVIPSSAAGHDRLPQSFIS